MNIDHVVEGHPEGRSDDVIQWYAKTLKMNRFWSIDDRQVYTEFSGLRASIVGNDTRDTQVVLVEPVARDRRFTSQVQVNDAKTGTNLFIIKKISES